MLRIVLDGSRDDVAPLLAPALTARLADFNHDVHRAVADAARQADDFVEMYRHLERKEFAFAATRMLTPQIMSVAFAGLDGRSTFEAALGLPKRASASGNRIEDARAVFPIRWSLEDIPVYELR